MGKPSPLNNNDYKTGWCPEREGFVKKPATTQRCLASIELCSQHFDEGKDRQSKGVALLLGPRLSSFRRHSLLYFEVVEALETSLSSVNSTKS